jgi:hypothetical protein
VAQEPSTAKTAEQPVTTDVPAETSKQVLETVTGSKLEDVEFVDIYGEQAAAEQGQTTEGQPDTETETAEESPDTETETAPVPPSDMMVKYGLDKQYQSEEDVFAAVAHQRTKIEEGQREASSLKSIISELIEKRGAEKPKPEEVSIGDDELAELVAREPRKAFKLMADELGYVKKDDVETIGKEVGALRNDVAWRETVQTVRRYDDLGVVADFMEAHPGEEIPPGTNPRWDIMRSEVNTFPYLLKIPIEQSLAITYRLANERELRKAKTVSTSVFPKVPVERKLGATSTSVGRSKVDTGSKIPPEILKGNSAGILKWMQEHGFTDF